MRVKQTAMRMCDSEDEIVDDADWFDEEPYDEEENEREWCD
jgi:hypothetical protein